MTTYRQLALQDLKDAGVSVASLIESYPQELMRFKLACDMGMTDIELADAETGCHPLNPAAEAWIELATAWPPKEAIAGITLPALDKAILFKISEGINVLAQLPLSLHTEVIRLKAIQKNGWAIKYITSDLQSETVRLAAVQQNGLTIAHIPADQQSESVRLAAVQHYGLAIQFIPAGQQSEAVCISAVQKYGRALQYIPAAKQSETLRLTAVQQNCLALEFIPADQQSKNVRLAALMSDKKSRIHMPPEIAKQLLAELDSNAGFSR
jgi:hypothetical protein